jgi:hypothetical protein
MAVAQEGEPLLEPRTQVSLGNGHTTAPRPRHAPTAEVVGLLVGWLVGWLVD